MTLENLTKPRRRRGLADVLLEALREIEAAFLPQEIEVGSAACACTPRGERKEIPLLS